MVNPSETPGQQAQVALSIPRMEQEEIVFVWDLGSEQTTKHRS